MSLNSPAIRAGTGVPDFLRLSLWRRVWIARLCVWLILVQCLVPAFGLGENRAAGDERLLIRYDCASDPYASTVKGGNWKVSMLGLLLSASMLGENYGTWNSSRKLFLNTTATGADISATHVTDFPVPVRLDTNNFNFSDKCYT